MICRAVQILQKQMFGGPNLSRFSWTLRRGIAIQTIRTIQSPRDYGGWVTDKAHVLKPPEITMLNTRIEALNQDFGVEMAVVTANDLLRFVPPKQHALWLFNRWGIGDSEAQNGLLMMLFPDIRRLEMITGDGMALHLTDAWLAQMQAQTIVPLLKKGEIGGGLLAGVDAVDRKLRGLVPADFDVQAARAQQWIMARKLASQPSMVANESSVELGESSPQGGESHGATVVQSTPSLPTFIAPIRSQVAASTTEDIEGAAEEELDAVDKPPSPPVASKPGFGGGESSASDKVWTIRALIGVMSIAAAVFVISRQGTERKVDDTHPCPHCGAASRALSEKDAVLPQELTPQQEKEKDTGCAVFGNHQCARCNRVFPVVKERLCFMCPKCGYNTLRSTSVYEAGMGRTTKECLTCSYKQEESGRAAPPVSHTQGGHEPRRVVVINTPASHHHHHHQRGDYTRHKESGKSTTSGFSGGRSSGGGAGSSY